MKAPQGRRERELRRPAEPAALRAQHHHAVRRREGLSGRDPRGADVRGVPVLGLHPLQGVPPGGGGDAGHPEG